MTFPQLTKEKEGRLGFVKFTFKAFAFLSRLGFIVVHHTDTSVRFENGAVFVHVYHGHFSYHVGVEIGRLPESNYYSLYEVLRSIAPAELAKALYQTTDPAFLEQCLTLMAQTVEQYCGQILLGSVTAFEHLEALVSPFRRADTLQAQFGPSIRNADHAWDTKDYVQAMTLYEEAREALDQTRLRRLAESIPILVEI